MGNPVKSKSKGVKKLKLFHRGLSSSKNKKSASRRIRTNLSAWLIMLPAVILLYILVWRPTVMGIVYSFCNMRGYNVEGFNGIKNYVQVITHTQFLPMLWNTVQYVLWSLVIGFLPPLFIAIMLNEVIHFRNGFRTLIYLPVVIPGIAAMLMWYFIYYPDETGLLNILLGKMGISPMGWLNNPRFAIIGIIIYSTWKNFGGAMLLYYAALQGVSTERYEAALIDGAGPFKRFWNVSRPAIEGLLLLQLVQQIISVFQTLEQPLAMTGGGPNGASMTLSLQLYNYGFRSGGRGTGQAMALGVVIFVILLIFTLFYFYLNKKVEDRY